MSSLADQVSTIENPDQPQCATVLVLDVSGSMEAEGRIRQLAEGLAALKGELEKDDLARKRVELAVVTFGERVEVAHDFSSIANFAPPALSASGTTPMGQAIRTAIDLVETRKAVYKAAGTDYYRPWIWLITDGEPTDMTPGDPVWTEVARQVRDGEQAKRFSFYAIGVEPARLDLLAQIAPPARPPLRLKPGCFKEMFVWLSRSQQAVSRSTPGEATKLTNPTGPAGWGEVSA